MSITDIYSRDMDWFWVTVALSLLAPLGGCILMALLKLPMGTNATFKVDFFAPYRDGQLGYVVVGWIGGALLEIQQFTSHLDERLRQGLLKAADYAAILAKSHSWTNELVAACWLVGALSALVAANGAANPVDVKTAATGTGDRLKKYSSFEQSLVLCVVGYIVINSVHNHVFGGA